MLAFLGWNPGTNQEIFSLDELVAAFTLERVSKSGAKFDPDKTRWFQQQYLRNKSDEELADELSQHLTESCEKSSLIAICRLMKERATFVQDIITEGAFLFDRPKAYDEKTVHKKWKETAGDLMADFRAELASLGDFSAASVETCFKSFIETRALGIGAVLPLFRLLLTGKGMGPSMFEIAAFLGKEESLERMSIGLRELASINAQ